MLLLPLVGLVLGRSARSSAAMGMSALLIWLNLWWLMPLAGLTKTLESLPAFVVWPSHAPVMALGYVVAFLLLAASLGAFSPRRGSPGDFAMRAARRGDYLAAGELWMEAGRPHPALRAFIRGRAWARAGETARSLGQLDKAVSFLQREGGEHLAAAAQIASRQRQEALAQQLWSRYGAYLVENRRPELAIDPFLRAGDPRRATHAVELALESHRLKAELVDVAIRATREAKRPQIAAMVAMVNGRPREAGDLFLAADMPLEAARAFSEAGDALRAAEALRQGGQVEQAAIMRGQKLAESGKIEEALSEFDSAGLYGESATILLHAGRYEDAFDRFRRAGRMREAADVAQQHMDPRTAAEIYAELGEWNDAGLCWESAGNPGEAARCFERAGDFQHAEELLSKAGLTADMARLLLRMGRTEEAFLALLKRGDMHGAWELLSSVGGTYPSLAEPLSRLATWLAAEAQVTSAISAVQRAVAGQAVSRELLPAFYTLAHLLEQHNDWRSAETVWQKIVDFDYSYKDAAPRLQKATARRIEDEQGHISGQQAPPPQAPITPPPDDAASRYILESELGRGGMGVVHRARDTRLGRTVAIKVLNSRQHTPDAIRRFEREARAAAALSHPGIVHIYDFDRGFGSFYISMEYVSGPTLNQLCKEEPPFVRRNLLNLMRQMVDAVAYAHSGHVVHRDLKPANMILADRRQVKILDFGIARRLDELDTSSSGATGTPYYMAPEQVLGEEPDTQTDIYSLGVTFFQLATGMLPFSTGNVLRAHLEQPPPDPQSLASDLEPAISHVILRCLAKSPKQRPRDGNALRAELSVLSDRGKD